MEKTQQESSPVYETITVKSGHTARVSITNACPTDLKESRIGIITTQTNDAYGAFTNADNQ